MSQLTDELKQCIQQAYSSWLEARGFRARRGQREMIAAIARVCTGPAPRLAAIEAGTGTGKTAAYCLAAIPIAQALEKTLIIASATVALQEQILQRDLPDLMERAGLEFDLALAKGRRRYVCLKRLEDQLRDPSRQDQALFEEADPAHGSLWAQMQEAFAAGRWNGELDSWPEGIDEAAWRPLTTDHHGCINNRCPFFHQCPFFKARRQLESAQAIVANQDLVLADLGLGGGVILPEPEESIFIIDEAHHLPDKTQQHFAARASVGGTLAWADRVNSLAASLTQRFGRPAELTELATKLADEGEALKVRMQDLGKALADLSFRPRGEGLEVHRFGFGRVDAGIAAAAEAAAMPLSRMGQDLQRLLELLRRAADGETSWAGSAEAEDWLPALGQMESRAAAAGALLDDYAGAAEEEATIRCARWVIRAERDSELISAPLEPGALLSEQLWARCFAAVATSATLTAQGRFDRFFERAGLDGIEGQRIPSPFDFPRIAVLSVPNMRSDPRDFDAHSAEVAELLPALLAKEPSALVLFTAWRQLERVRQALPKRLEDALQVQGEAAKQLLLERHRRRVDAGEPSYLLGVASFAEGLDLPGSYCRHVLIIKLPFAVPEDPLDEAMGEWAEARGRNAFFEISVPDAALKLVQACGRLIRHEDDRGRITVLDKRLHTRSYGRILLETLPPYRLDLPGGAAKRVAASP